MSSARVVLAKINQFVRSSRMVTEECMYAVSTSLPSRSGAVIARPFKSAPNQGLLTMGLRSTGSQNAHDATERSEMQKDQNAETQNAEPPSRTPSLKTLNECIMAGRPSIQKKSSDADNASNRTVCGVVCISQSRRGLCTDVYCARRWR